MKNKFNRDELTALDYLLTTKGYTIEQIRHNTVESPDFICSDGKKYEVKHDRTATFSLKQLSVLEDDDIILLVNGNKIREVLWGILKTGEKRNVVSEMKKELDKQKLEAMKL